MTIRLDEKNICTVQGNGEGVMPTRLDENNTCIVHGNWGGGLCPHASTRITPLQFKEMGGGAMPTRLDDIDVCTVQTYTNPVGSRVERNIDL